jgi:hypothetical protein
MTAARWLPFYGMVASVGQSGPDKGYTMRYIIRDFSLLMSTQGGHLYFRPITADVAQKYITTCPMITQAVNNSYVARMANESLGENFVDYCVQDIKLTEGDDLLVPLVLENGIIQWYYVKFNGRFGA